MQFFNSSFFKTAMNKILLAFIFYLVASISFGGYVSRWSASVNNHTVFGFNVIYDGTAYRPYVYRRLLFSGAEKIENLLSEKTREKFTNSIKKRNFTQYFPNLDSKHYLVYHLVYFLSFACLFSCLFVLRKIGFEITGNITVGTISACCFGLLLPLTDSRFFYDFSELLFFSLAILFSMKGWWQALIILSPIAEYNKESFLFFLITLFPILALKIGTKKAIIVNVTSIILSGFVYLHIRSIFENNPGDTVIYSLLNRLEYLEYLYTWFRTDIYYGMIFGFGIFLPYLLIIAWLIKCTWKKLPPIFKYHLGIASALNIPLYILFCPPTKCEI